MTQTKHTPGPWTAHICKTASDLWEIKNENGDIAYIALSNNKKEVDARLIAAAPELLEALHLTLRNVHAMIYQLPVKSGASGPHYERQSLESWAERVRAAIAKAEGGQ